nr:hypothetical protein [Tanacetum cinerariifolium]
MQRSIYGEEKSRNRGNNSWKCMAVYSLGSQHPRTSTNGPRRTKILGNSHRTLHEIDRSKAFDHCKCKTCRKICMGICGITHGDNKQNREATNSKPTRIGDDLPQVLWIHRILPKNNQKETLFSLIYGSEAIILTVKSNVAKDDRGRTKEVTKRKESKEVASIEEAYYQNEPHKYHSKRSNHSTYKVGDFILLLQNNIENLQVWQGPHMIREIHEGELNKIIDASDHSFIQTAKGANLRNFYM